ncbi:hypothetical protein JWS13_37560 [Rhodococcus pseudokoreensis]|uniref:Histidine kinase-, DNA gyrase B-, and HSP90-like ATPase n=1 Tax=Rhodococcus pseudokoreensis TaxID=2811421 RepID=A0A974WB31_9NOCA|nr:hypothetical protein [Rhodococcus pseudokoreensis]QSE93905.1 hypothetical protein JWS13_37560 [Rhodococcus pseudokoreensis]
MNRSEWWSQPVAAEGSTASEGIRRQLGKPQLDPLSVLVRETAQNSCDAALPGGGDINFDIRLHQLSGRRLEAWRDFLLPEPPGSNLGVEKAMSGSPMVMLIADRGTTGLGGPLRADEPALDGERPDFVNFIRNVGERKAVNLGGGSYGFGKGILYNVSRCHIVVADSVCIFRGKRQRRLIAAALGDGFSRDGVRYTGRHWLGLHEAGFARALLDDEAEKLAYALGLPRFHENETGTTVAVVDADLGRQINEAGKEQPRDADSAAEFILSTMMWNLWPHMLTGRPNRLVCTVKRDGFALDVPDPESLLELRPFAKAYRKLSKDGEYEVPVRKTAPTEIGRFALVKDMAPVRASKLLAAAAPFQGRAHHCARMRHADLVVDYVAGDAPTDESLQYGAVFRVSEQADQHFADAEPPTHDDWVTNGLQGTARGVVQLAKGFIKNKLTGHAGEAASPANSTAEPLAALSGRLSGLVAGTPGDGAIGRGDGDTRSGRKSSRSTGGPRFAVGPALVEEDGRPVILATVQMPTWASIHTVIVEPFIVVDGGIEDPNEFRLAPTVVGWRGVESGETREGASISIDRMDERRWQLRVVPVDDAVVRLRLRVLEVAVS